MKKKKKIYGVSGMMEYQAVIRIGKAMMKVPFSDGSATAMGTKPAKFTTSNFVVQHAIEHSADFKRGRIYIVSEIELDEDLHIEGNGEAKGKEVPEASAEEEEGLRAECSEKTTNDIAEPSKIEKEFSCNDDAKDYLESEYGVLRSKMRTRADILAQGQANGIDIKFV